MLNQKQTQIVAKKPLLMTSLLEKGKIAARFKAEIMDPNSGKTKMIEQKLTHTDSTALAAFAVKESIQQIKESYKVKEENLDDELVTF